MIKLKSRKEMESMKTGGAILHRVLAELMPQIEVDMTTNEIDQRATKLIRGYGADLSFNKVPGYKWATCLPINEQTVHTTPSDRKIKDGDILTVDIGAFYEGFHTDTATTEIIGTPKDQAHVTFLEVGKKSLEDALAAAKVGNYVGDISQAFENIIYGNGYFVLHELTGHGVGRDLHEPPFIPGYVDRPRTKTPKLVHGMTLAIEIIYSMGSEKIAHEKGDSWSIITADKSMSACFEHSIALIDENTYTLT